MFSLGLFVPLLNPNLKYVWGKLRLPSTKPELPISQQVWTAPKSMAHSSGSRKWDPSKNHWVLSLPLKRFLFLHFNVYLLQIFNLIFKCKAKCLVRFPLEKLNRSLFSSYYDCKVLLKTYINNTCVGGQMTQKFISSRSTNTLHFSHTLWRSRSSPPLPGHHVINFLHRSHVISHY